MTCVTRERGGRDGPKGSKEKGDVVLCIMLLDPTILRTVLEIIFPELVAGAAGRRVLAGGLNKVHGDHSR